MLRADEVVRVDAMPRSPANVGALLYRCAVEEMVLEAAEQSPPTGPSISPSRAADFMTCPLLYRFRVIARLPEPPTTATARGTLVHAVLERLFDLPAAGRTPAAAEDMLIPEWTRLCADDELLAALITDEEERARFVADD